MSNVAMVTGGMAILQCNRPVEGCPLPTVTWKYIDSHDSSRHIIINTNNFTKLIITNVTVQDSGMYQCQVSSDGLVLTKEIILTVSSE